METTHDAARVKFLQKERGERGMVGKFLLRLTSRERYLAGISCILFVACVAFILVAFTRDSQSQSYCLSATCVSTAAQLLAAMDVTADPCEDFFEYACGQWNKRNVIPDDEHSFNTFEKLHDELQIILRQLLEEKESLKDSNATTKAKVFYKSCMNITQINNERDAPLHDVTEDLGGWPIIKDNWDSDSFVLETVLAEIRRGYNAPILIGCWVEADDKNSSRYIIQLDQPVLGMPDREYYLKGKSESEFVQAYLSFMRGVVHLMGSPGDDVEDQLMDLLEFETELANVTRPRAERHDTGALYNKMTITKLQLLVPQIDWLLFLRHAVNPSLTADEEVLVFAVDYLYDMMNIVQQKDKRTVANYLIWRVVMMLAPELSEDYQEVHNKYKMVLHGVKRGKIRWKKCVEDINKHMGLAVGAMFVRENFKPESKETALEMIRDIRNAFNELLDENEWMDEETKAVAKQKANAMDARIGYPDFITDPQKLDAKYAGLDLEEDHYFNNILAIKRFDADTKMSRLRDTVLKDVWEQPPAEINAFYNPNANDIVFPAAILQPLFYSAKFP
ncbi:neprilysin-1-like, partial [Littorina saxatilis]|uniref:neprilysin-1-like n=1 Tax=Littorina saxatilis TaxID=31220 RepID=UPI0038B45B35